MALICAGVAFGQSYSGLATDSTGERLALISPLARPGDSLERPLERLYRFEHQELRTVADLPRAPQGCFISAVSLTTPVFAAGNGFLWHDVTYCGPRMPLVPIPRIWTAHNTGIAQLPETISGQLQFSPEGKWAGIQPNVERSPRIVDLSTGKETVVPSPPDSTRRLALASSRHAISSNGGAILLERAFPPLPVEDNVRAFLWQSGKLGAFGLPGVRECVLDPRERYMLCALTDRFVSIDLTSGRESTLATGERFQPSLSGDGATLLLQSDGALRLFAMPRGEETQSLLDDAFDSTISSDGRVVYAASAGGSLWRFDLDRGEKREWLGPAPSFFSPRSSLTPGSLFTMTGKLALPAPVEMTGEVAPASLEGFEVRFDGEPLPMFKVGPAELRFQIPWDAALDVTRRVEIRHERNPHFLAALFSFSPGPGPAVRLEHIPDGIGLLAAAHDDFRGPVTVDDPARPGETIHVYATGLGPTTTGFSETGRRTPAGAHPVLATPTCAVSPAGTNAFRYSREPATVVYAGLAGDLLGLYQIDVTLPMTLSGGTYAAGPKKVGNYAYLFCGYGDDNDQVEFPVR